MDLDPRNPLARYEKAGVLAASNTDVGVVRAIAELEALMSIAPGEASVYFQVRMALPPIRKATIYAKCG